MKDTSLDCMILDATFVGREGGNTETQSLDGLLSKVRAALSVGARIFLMFDNADHGFSLYESIYEAFLQGLSKMRNIAVYMGLEIYTFSRWVIRQYVRKEVQSLDPRLLQFLKRRKNVFEPVALYRNNYGAQANLNLKYHSSRGEKLIFLESLACLNRLEKLLVESGTTARENDLVFSIGRMGALARFREKIERSNAFRSAEIAYLTGAEWSLHSSESALRSFLEQTECANRIYLFHNNEERLAAFSKTLHNPKIESICAVPDTVELS